jgi:hypothetical protein
VLVDHTQFAQAHAQGSVIDVMLTGPEHLRGAFPRHLVEGRQVARVSFVRGFQGLAPGRDVPQLQILVVGQQCPRKRILRRVIEDQ